nr:tail fiber protein [Escherichia coli]
MDSEGITQLSSATNSTSEVLAATAVRLHMIWLMESKRQTLRSLL